MQEQIVPETYVSIVKDQHVERPMTQVKSSLEFQVRSQLEWAAPGVYNESIPVGFDY